MPGNNQQARTVVLATRNQGKLREMRELLEPHGFRVLPVSELDDVDVAETASTFVENALIKAREAAAVSGLPAIADDSGLEVDALGGAPGVRSARYSGDDASDEDNVARLLDALAGIHGGARSAHFRCVAVYLAHPQHPAPVIREGTWDGLVLDAPRGEGGFGYDPVFLDLASGLSAAELEPAEKNRRSHRGQAVSALASVLAARGVAA